MSTEVNDSGVRSKVTDILSQAKKGQGETNGRLDELIAEQKVTNRWLAHIAQLLESQTGRSISGEVHGGIDGPKPA